MILELLGRGLTALGVQPEEIRPESEPYLTRWRLIESPALGVYLHRFVASDPSPTKLHNHPWYGLSLILSGSYMEARAGGPPGDRFGMIAWRERRWFNFIRPDTHHRVDLHAGSAPVWTLLFRGPREGRRWEFVEPRIWRRGMT
jgi:hypothetical protein